jgi:hypothetical protein
MEMLCVYIETCRHLQIFRCGAARDGLGKCTDCRRIKQGLVMIDAAHRTWSSSSSYAYKTCPEKAAHEIRTLHHLS